ncbi:hypothetical protein BJ508DRAFT_219953 [Ascobolus immersus RN42]|uniref:CwfJ domain protein n=1 Tax=Ascobolus immersus RN42 TaxID=1160509 RepID=A0A3N4INI7_ASCIM|nr:hypothetical protein BJ508DRAFT_219953 [Ascobolus immersus RN42]
MSVKILVAGSPATAPEYSLSGLFTKIATLHKKVNFNLCIVLGDLFPAIDATQPDPTSAAEQQLDDLLSGKINISVPTYFGIGNHSLPKKLQEKVDRSNGEVCENLFFWGRKSIMTTSEGVRIVAFGGKWDGGLIGGGTKDGDEGTEPSSSLGFYSEADIKGGFGAHTKPVDILITSEFPEGIDAGSRIPITEEVKDAMEGRQRKVLAELATRLRPRYHFTTGGLGFWEREPYMNPAENNKEPTPTRFLAIASQNNPSKAKALYAFNFNPAEPPAHPASFTPIPYISSARGKKRPNPDSSTSFRWSTDDNQQHSHRNKHRKNEPRPPPGPDSCFFCLSYPRLEKHLITSIGTEAYVTTAKGPLPLPSDTLPFPAHVLIIPLSHTPLLSLITPEDSCKSTQQELRSYKSAIEKMLKEKYNHNAITFEVGRARGVHAHWQLVPLPSSITPEQIYECFQKEVRTDDLGSIQEVEETEENMYEEGYNGDFFRWWVGGQEGKRWEVRLEEGKYFDLQFGRRVCAELLGVKGRTHWKDCAQSYDDEVKDAEGFKEAFKEYDFSL